MKKKFSTSWISSTKPSKQRKYRYNAPLHILGKFASSLLSKDLRKKYGRRNLTLRKGDKVKVMRGQFKGKSGTIEAIIRSESLAHITGVEITKKEGAKRKIPVHTSNLMIIEPNTEDKLRRKKLESASKATKSKPVKQ